MLGRATDALKADALCTQIERKMIETAQAVFKKSKVKKEKDTKDAEACKSFTQPPVALSYLELQLLDPSFGDE